MNSSLLPLLFSHSRLDDAYHIEEDEVFTESVDSNAHLIWTHPPSQAHPEIMLHLGIPMTGSPLLSPTALCSEASCPSILVDFPSKWASRVSVPRSGPGGFCSTGRACVMS